MRACSRARALALVRAYVRECACALTRVMMMLVMASSSNLASSVGMLSCKNIFKHFRPFLGARAAAASFERQGSSCRRLSRVAAPLGAARATDAADAGADAHEACDRSAARERAAVEIASAAREELNDVTCAFGVESVAAAAQMRQTCADAASEVKTANARVKVLEEELERARADNAAAEAEARARELLLQVRGGRRILRFVRHAIRSAVGCIIPVSRESNVRVATCTADEREALFVPAARLVRPH
eukprot:6186032-Pleurochrysis_carterae.AAC.1